MADASYQIDLFNEIRDRAMIEIPKRVALLIMMSVGPTGETFGDTPISPGERMARMLVNSRIGQQDMLEHINPKYAGQKARQFIEDMKQSPFIAHTYEGGPKAPPPLPTPQPITGPNIFPTQQTRPGILSQFQSPNSGAT